MISLEWCNNFIWTQWWFGLDWGNASLLSLVLLRGLVLCFLAVLEFSKGLGGSFVVFLVPDMPSCKVWIQGTKWFGCHKLWVVPTWLHITEHISRDAFWILGNMVTFRTFLTWLTGLIYTLSAGYILLTHDCVTEARAQMCYMPTHEFNTRACWIQFHNTVNWLPLTFMLKYKSAAELG